jgi:charged multivesicular body protein 6
MGGAFSSSSSSSSSSGNNANGKTKKPAGGISSVDRAMLDLKNARDRLNKYKTKLQRDESKLTARAKQCKVEGQTKTALNLLKLRKLKLREVDQVEGQLLTVMQLVGTIDSKQNESQVLEAMKKGKDTLQQMHEEVTVDHVIELMDQVTEQHEIEKEISDILEGVPSTLSVEDEAAIEAELEALMLMGTATTTTTTTTTTLPEVPNTVPLPTAPTTKLPEATTTAEAEQRVAVAS